MDVFEFRKQLISEYESFTRSFVRINADDIRDAVDKEYKDGHFWPPPLIQLNPNFVSGGFVDDLAAEGKLETECKKIFRFKSQEDPIGDPMMLHKHQTDAIDIAQKYENYVLTTGTGSGKSLSYIIPIVNDVLKRKKSGDTGPKITAIVVYPMNALCNSQLLELKKFLGLGYEEGRSPVTFARYTGQSTDEERDQIAKNPPDILLTNYMMLELIMTRLLPLDTTVREHAKGLRYLVLDELHTYRGRQGADVSMLVRRVRERFNDDLICIGTSATMATEGTEADRRKAIADVSSKLFGSKVSPSNIITETLQSVTEVETYKDKSELNKAIEAGVPVNPTFDGLKKHPIAAWVEHRIGLEKQDGKLVRISKPLSVKEASEKLAEESGLEFIKCQEYLSKFLLAANDCYSKQGQSFFAFRLHQFISGAWNVYSTLEEPEKRYLTLEGQQYKPNDRKKALYAMCFCRLCGQEYYPVWASMSGKKPVQFTSRDLSDRGNSEDDVSFGYLKPDISGEFKSLDIQEQYPDEWLEYKNSAFKLKPYYRKISPIDVEVDTLGKVVSEKGMASLYIPGTFRYCLNSDCDAYYHGGQRSDLSKLSGLSSEGRSSATTVLALHSLKYLYGTGLDDDTKKLLAFTDNRQDASLQSGHFNDFIHVLLLRSALLAAASDDNGDGLTNDNLTQKVLAQLQLEPIDYAANPRAKGKKAEEDKETLRNVLGYRLYHDLKRGWRVTNPNLEQLKLLQIEYQGLQDCCQDEEEWGKCSSEISSLSSDERFDIAKKLLDLMRSSLCIKTIYLDSSFLEKLKNKSFNDLKVPWGIGEEEKTVSNSYMVLGPRPRRKTEHHAVYVSHLSVFGRKVLSQIRANHKKKLNEKGFYELLTDMLRVLTTYGIVNKDELTKSTIGYTVNSSVLSWRCTEDDDQQKGTTNAFFSSLYQNIAALLGKGRLLHVLEAREHTSQVEDADREEREERFRKGIEGEKVVGDSIEPPGLPILFCTPTMELGIDISNLNAVYMRNVPPTPANYVQRSGRAGRGGNSALVITYCAARSPHDQYFFFSQPNMVAGAVNPPTIDLANEDLVRSHLQAIWLTETGAKLGNSVHQLLELNDDDMPVKEDYINEIATEKAGRQTGHRAQRILGLLEQELSKYGSYWYTDTWLSSMLNSIQHRLDASFDRWRSMYKATKNQMQLANAIIANGASTEKQRKEAKARYDDAFAQQRLLLEDRKTMNSDFYTYRYLASEGFLPGYNFPRLPLLAYIPGRRGSNNNARFLSRPRFLGITEFGPRSIIYHEGSTYNVRRTILTVHEEGRTTSRLPVQLSRFCPSCGHGHTGKQSEFESCVNCNANLNDGLTIQNLYRIDQVSTRRITRITSDEEERQRQGYETKTTFRFSEENGQLRKEELMIKHAGTPLMEMKFGPAASLWRINIGWLRRDKKSIHGFNIDTDTGEWAKDAQSPTSIEDDEITNSDNLQRITPYVEDTRNILVFHPYDNVPTKDLMSLQYALKRGIEQEHQLEESELASELLPDRVEPKAIMFYESAEGGAGVLTRLVKEPGSMSKVARKALEICHYSSSSGNWEGYDDLENQKQDCEAGCYRCLLSYYNQPYHAEIDRASKELLNFLCQLAKADDGERHSNCDSFEELMNASGSGLEKQWLKFIKDGSYSLPDKGQPYIKEFNTRPDFAYTRHQVLVYIDGPHHEQDEQKQLDERITRELEDNGYTVVRFDADMGKWEDVISKYSWCFGSGVNG